MSRNRRVYKCIVLLMLAGIPGWVFAQKTEIPYKRGKYSLVTYVGGGLSYYSGVAGTPVGLNANVNKLGPAATLRVLWHPDHYLNIGLESGWTTFYSYKADVGSDKAIVRLTGIPMLLVLAMPVGKHFKVMIAPGGFLLNSHLDYGGVVNSKKFSFGFMAGAAYEFPVTERLRLAAEAKFMNSRETKDASLSLQLMVIWRILQW